MFLSTQLEFWQPVAVKAITEFTTQEPALGGCTLADMMGLGKTWVIICFLLWVISEVVGNQDDLSKLRSRVDYASNLDEQATKGLWSK